MKQVCAPMANPAMRQPSNEEMRIVPHDLAILAGARFGFVGVDHEIMGPPVGLLGHERPFAGRWGKPAPPRPRRPEASSH